MTGLAAAKLGAGALGFLLVVLLIVAVAGLMWAMSGSLRRMRGRVSSGEFGREDPRRRGRHGRRGDPPTEGDSELT